MTFQKRHNPRTLILIKGNPKYWLNISQKFYNDIKQVFKDFKIIEIESDIISSNIPKTTPNDIILGFSRGCGYAKRLKHQGYKGIFVGIGCSKYEPQDYQLKNPNDKTDTGDMSQGSLKAHWTLTPEMIKKLEEIKNG